MSMRVFFSAMTFATLLPMAAQAAPITYNVNRTIGVGSVVGTITTDGTFGALTDTNISEWSLTLNNGTASFLLSSSPLNSQHLINGVALQADADSIDFDFDATSGFLLFQNPQIGSAQNYWCVEISGCGSFIQTGETVVTTPDFGATAGRTGVVTIATVGTNGVPEPATFALAGLALLGMAATRLRRA